MDYLRECNDQGITEGDFVAVWCSRCLREECPRSIKGKTRFEARVSTWEQRLFTQRPVMAETDPRYSTLTAKHFQEAPGRALEVRGWDVPQPEPTELPKESAQLPSVSADPGAAPPYLQLTRVPNQAGRTLTTAPAGRAAGETVIRPGGRVKVGGSGVESK
jgi:hypothetical protein